MSQLESKVERYCEVFCAFNVNDIDVLDTIYDQNIRFTDPFQTINDLTTFKRMMHHSYSRLNEFHVDIHRVVFDDIVAMLTWRMEFSHPRIKKGETINLDGCSELIFADKITHHRDYFDAGQMVYEHIPVLRTFVHMVKNRVAV